MSRDRLSILSLAAALALPVVPATVGTASAAAPTCHGQTATIVGERGGSVDGTDGPDVIVVNGVSVVFGRKGDDLICSASRDNGSDLYIYGDEGDDVVDTTGNVGISTSVELGPGDDTYLGGDEHDYVSQNSGAEGTDTVSTGGGRDVVLTGGTKDAPDRDVISLGAGTDHVHVVGAVLSGQWRGGPGPDRIGWEGTPGPGEYLVDNVEGRLSRNGTELARWSSFVAFDFFMWPRDLTFIGSDQADEVRSMVHFDELQLGGGDDDLYLAPEDFDRASAMTLRGGPGNDALRLGESYTSGDVDLRLGPGTLRFVRPRQAGSTSSVRGFERSHVVSEWAHVVGTSSADRIRWNACDGEVLGAEGADIVTYLPVQEVTCGTGGDLVVNGGPGPDVLVGGRLADRLVGGLGRDSADGRAGRDVCRAETKVRCER